MPIQGEDNVRFIVVQHIQQHSRITRSKLNRNMGVFTVKIDIVGVDHILADRIRGHDANMSGKLILFVGFFLELICERTNLMGVVYKIMTAIRQRDGMIDSFK